MPQAARTRGIILVALLAFAAQAHVKEQPSNYITDMKNVQHAHFAENMVDNLIGRVVKEQALDALDQPADLDGILRLAG